MSGFIWSVIETEEKDMVIIIPVPDKIPIPQERKIILM